MARGWCPVGTSAPRSVSCQQEGQGGAGAEFRAALTAVLHVHSSSKHELPHKRRGRGGRLSPKDLAPRSAPGDSRTEGGMWARPPRVKGGRRPRPGPELRVSPGSQGGSGDIGAETPCPCVDQRASKSQMRRTGFRHPRHTSLKRSRSASPALLAALLIRWGAAQISSPCENAK